MVSDILMDPLTHIINVCISTSQFPRIWKTARISPVPKIDSPKNHGDYRPISILPALSKVFERLVLNQLVGYIDDQSLLRPSISGFRKGHSTTTVLLGIRDDLMKARNRGEVTMMVMADYSKAFDTVRFKSVLTKMHLMGFSKEFLSWMLNYLCDRRQFVQIDTRISNHQVIQFGVPQGSILGPFIFNLYVADLQDHVECQCFQYADDTTFYIHCKACNLDDCTSKLNDAISSLVNYSNDSNLALNTSKTKWMLFSTAKMSQIHKLDNIPFNVNCQGEPLERVNSIRLLGLQFDEHLTWNEHITKTLASCYGTLAVLRKLKHLAPYHVRKQLAESLVLAKLDYASVVFDPLPSYQMRRLQRVQNACAGFVLKKYGTESDLSSLKWFNIEQRRKLSILKLAFKALNDCNFPEYSKLCLHSVAAYNLRSSVAPVIKIPKESGTFQAIAATHFNNLPSDVRNIKDYRVFCTSIKQFL